MKRKSVGSDQSGYASHPDDPPPSSSAAANASLKDASHHHHHHRHHHQEGREKTKDPTLLHSASATSLLQLADSDFLLPCVLPFKKSQLEERYPKGHARGRHWKHLKQILQAENYHLSAANEATYTNIESPPSMYPSKKYCDITGFEAPYTDPCTKLHFANSEIFKRIRALPNEYVQGYLALRNAAIVLK